MTCSATSLAHAQSKCAYAKLGEFEVTMQGTQGMVAAKINGIDANLLVDSGAFFSTLDSSAMGRFALKKGMMPPNMIVRGVGGQASFGVGKADTVEVGTFKLTGAEFLIGGPTFGSRAAGILGQNVLSAADVEYDFANGIIRMFKGEDCEKANLAYWAGDKPVSMLTMMDLADSRSMIIGSAKVNGETIRVIFDSGASASVLKKSAAERLARQGAGGLQRGHPRLGQLRLAREPRARLSAHGSVRQGDRRL